MAGRAERERSTSAPRPGPGVGSGRFPAAALFDLDGTLVDTEPLKSLALVRACEAVDVAIPAEVLERLVGRAWQDVHRILDLARRPGWDLEAFLDAVMVETDGLLGEGWSIDPLPGAVELLRRLVADGVPVGVVTGSFRRELEAVVELLGLHDVLAVTLAAEDYTAGKPDPECYLAAASALAVPPSRCVVFEDSTPGIASGRAAGMAVVASAAANPAPGEVGHQDQSGAHVVVGDLHGVTEAVLDALARRRPGE